MTLEVAAPVLLAQEKTISQGDKLVQLRARVAVAEAAHGVGSQPGQRTRGSRRDGCEDGGGAYRSSVGGGGRGSIETVENKKFVELVQSKDVTREEREVRFLACHVLSLLKLHKFLIFNILNDLHRHRPLSCGRLYRRRRHHPRESHGSFAQAPRTYYFLPF